MKININLGWPAITCVSLNRIPQKNVTHEFIRISPAVPSMFCSSHMGGLYDGSLVAVQLLFCKVLLQRSIQSSTKHLCVVHVIICLFFHKNKNKKVYYDAWEI